jgi:hypothetical protein
VETEEPVKLLVWYSPKDDQVFLSDRFGVRRIRLLGESFLQVSDGRIPRSYCLLGEY